MEQQKITTLISDIDTLCDLISPLAQSSWSEQEVGNLCTQSGIVLSANTYTQSLAQIQNFQTFDYNNLMNKLAKSKKFYMNLLDRGHEWTFYNIPYRNRITQQIEAMINALQRTNSSFTPTPNSSLATFLSALFSQLKNLTATVTPNIDELFEHFKYGNKNYVVFGKNGAGKTTLLRKISSEVLKDNSVVVPASRNVAYQDNVIHFYNPSYSFNQKLSDIQTAPILYLLHELVYKSLHDYEQGKIRKTNSKSIATRIFESLGLERNIVFGDNETVFLHANNIANKYSTVGGSDGERAALYMILAVLLSPENSFLFIDEPENHLNGLLMQNLFTALETERPDVRFIYFTHNIDFIESRNNIELIYLEKTDKFQEWSFRKVEDFASIDISVILNIAGSQQDVIFCEGKPKTSIDTKILKALYPTYTIIPVGSCEQVISNTSGINGQSNFFRRKAFGVVDKDFRTAQEVSVLNAANIAVLPCSEWENVLLSELVLNKVNKSLFDKDMKQIISELLKTMSDRKNIVINDLLDKRFIRIISASKFRYSDNLAEEIDNQNTKNKNDLLAEVSKLSNDFDKYIADKDYSELIKIFPGKSIIKDAFAMLGGGKLLDDYIDKVVTLISSDTNFAHEVRESLGTQSIII